MFFLNSIVFSLDALALLSPVSHATYGVQLGVAREVLTAHHDYARKEKSDFYGLILDEWEPPPPEPKES